MAAKKPVKAKPTSKPSAKKVERIVSIPDDIVLSPQSEVPRQLTGRDQSRGRSTVREISWADFDRSVQQLARMVANEYDVDVVVGVAHGGVFVGGALSSALKRDFYPVRISRRSRDKVLRKQPRLSGEMPKELAGKRVLIVDDVAASGDTLDLATTLARKVGAKDVKTCCLVTRAEGFTPDFSAVETEQLVVFPWDYEDVAEDVRFDVDPDKAGA